MSDELNIYRVMAKALERNNPNAALYMRELIQKVEALRVTPADAEPVTWKCFHCGETFTDERCARAHFGRHEDCTPACIIKGGEGGLLEALRRAEEAADDAIQMVHAESTDAAKAYHAQRCRHNQALIAAEQAGYDKGLADGRAHPPTDRRDALEEAAKVADKVARDAEESLAAAEVRPARLAAAGALNAASYISAAIRALQPQPAPTAEYRCHHCKRLIESDGEPDQCPDCKRRSFSEVASPAPDERVKMLEDYILRCAKAWEALIEFDLLPPQHHSAARELQYAARALVNGGSHEA